MSNFIFTPGQREEALSWIKENCPEIINHFEYDSPKQDWLVDMYLKLKALSFSLKPTEFVVGVEYKDEKAVTEGKEIINLTFHNPHREDKPDYFAQAILVQLLNSLITKK